VAWFLTAPVGQFQHVGIALVDCKEAVMRHPHPWIRQYFGGPRGRAAIGEN